MNKPWLDKYDDWEPQDYTVRQDLEHFEIPSGEPYRLACCDCGLVHDVVLTSHDGKSIGFAAKINDERTAERRQQLTSEPL